MVSPVCMHWETYLQKCKPLRLFIILSYYSQEKVEKLTKKTHAF